ncbi:MAG: SDR family NAD(P)-dependent oxidoreductase [Halioglobus sp.]
MATARSVLITGATRGLGAGLARQFAARGYRLALTGRKRQELEQLAAELADKAPDIVLETLDVCEFDSVAAVVQRCAERLGGLDIVVINAGVGFPTPVGEGHFSLVRQTIDVNLTGAIATAEAAVELFRRQGHGQIVGITSVARERGMRGQSAYCASKAGFNRYLQSLRLETRKNGIVVTELAPGYIDSDMSRSVPNRIFTVSNERGTGIMADLIERKVHFRHVPPWPWSVIGRVIRWLPDGIVARL